MYNPKRTGDEVKSLLARPASGESDRKSQARKIASSTLSAASGLFWLMKFQISKRSLTASGVNSYFSIRSADDRIVFALVRLAGNVLHRGSATLPAGRRRNLRQSLFEYLHGSRLTKLPAHEAWRQRAPRIHRRFRRDRAGRPA